MKMLRILSIVGIVLFTLCLIESGLVPDWETTTVWAAIATIYAIPFSIAGLVVSLKAGNPTGLFVADDLMKLHSLKEKGVFSEEEYNTRKMRILK